MIVDTDFILALLKPDDWLKPAATRVFAAHAGELRGTEAGLVELLWMARRYRLDAVDLIAAAHATAPFPDRDVALKAAWNCAREGLSPIDAVLAAHAECRGEVIVSSDETFDRAGVKRVRLR